MSNIHFNAVLQSALVAFGQCAVTRSSDLDVTQARTLLDITSESIRVLISAMSRFTNLQQLGRGSTQQQQQQQQQRWGAGGRARQYDARSTDSTSSSTSRSGRGDGFGGQQWAQQQQEGSAGAGFNSGTAGFGMSYEQLMGLRVRELKKLLQESGVDSADCFEKEELARRVLERCRV
jgi:hypothetical protein